MDEYLYSCLELVDFSDWAYQKYDATIAKLAPFCIPRRVCYPSYVDSYLKHIVSVLSLLKKTGIISKIKVHLD